MNLLVTGAWTDAKAHISELERMGHTVQFLQQEKAMLPCAYEWVEGVVCNGLFLHHPIENFIHLRYIQLTSAGFDRVPMEYVKHHGIEIHNARGVYSIPMAEFAVAGVLQLYKKSRLFAENQRQHRWAKHRSLPELHGKTVVIVGCGNVGTECARRFKAFGCRVVGLNRTARDGEMFDQTAGLSELDTWLPKADVVILAIALTDETRYLMDTRRFAMLKPTAVLVNIARGAVVDTQALIGALPHLGGAVLDVFEEEPLSEDSPLWDTENVILTPHSSFVGDGNGERLWNVIVGNLIKTGRENEKRKI